uniref:Ig-like domain-containing protein n=1 Tax=Nothoprocta perdicaria TaxID=30464 RepID=A0A8C7EH23_NOTPE
TLAPFEEAQLCFRLPLKALCQSPFIQMPTPIVALREGQSTTFECQVVGTPEIHVTWYLDGNEVTDRAKYSISFIDGLATLKVTQAKVCDSGTYVCEAHNDAGSESSHNPAGKASCSTKVTVKG